MALPSPNDILKVPGKLCLNPTDLAQPYPHGGTPLGAKREARWSGGETATPVTAEEWGDIPTSMVRGRLVGSLAVTFRSWDADVLAAMFSDTVAGPSTGLAVLRGRVAAESTREGVPIDKSVCLLFTPTASQHPALIVYRAEPEPQATDLMNMTFGQEFGISAVWLATPDGTGRLYNQGLLEDLSL